MEIGNWEVEIQDPGRRERVPLWRRAQRRRRRRRRRRERLDRDRGAVQQAVRERQDEQDERRRFRVSDPVV
jgi:hypothetical protein